MGSLAGNSIQRIAIIGGGPSGIATAKYLLNERAFSDVQVYEQSDSIEGAWKYVTTDADVCKAPQSNPFQPLDSPKENHSSRGEIVFTTPMYTTLETNIPHQLMQYAHQPFPTNVSLYPLRQTVSRYLHDYAAEVMDMVKFHTQVQDVRLLRNGEKDAWSLSSCDLRTGEQRTQIYDAIAVCSGHYSTYHIPRVLGLEKWNSRYPKSIGHSKFYRSSEVYRGKEVVVVGNSASGMDIANQISEVSQCPLIMSQRSASWLSGSHSKSEEQRIVMKPQIEEFLDADKPSRAVRFSDGSVEDNIDFVLFCTGYLYSLPFLTSLLSELIRDGSRVHNLYKHMFFMDHPSLAFVALPMRVIPFPLAEVQATAIAKVWSGQLFLPSKMEMKEWERLITIENGPGKKFLTLDGGRDFLYHNELYDWVEGVGFKGNIRPHKWTDKEFWLRSKFPDMKRAYAQRGQGRFDIQTSEELGFVAPT